MKKDNIVIIAISISMFLIGTSNSFAQNKTVKNNKSGITKSIGGEEHDANIYGVKIGMDVPTALEKVFVNANRKPGQEKPDAMKKEGKDKTDIRVVYKDLPRGEMQIVFDQGKYVREIILLYKNPIQYSDLLLPYRNDVAASLEGQRYDDRYTFKYTDIREIQRIWYRDEKGDGDFNIRVIFTSSDKIKYPQYALQKIVEKSIAVVPGDEEKFRRSFN